MERRAGALNRCSCMDTQTQDRPTDETVQRGSWGIKDCFGIVAVFLILFLVLPPAVVQMREAARRQTCHENLRQLGVALNAYHDVHETFPPAANWGAEGLDLPKFLTHEEPTHVEVTR